MRRGIAIFLFVFVILIIFLITIEVFSDLNDLIYQNLGNDKIAHLFFACILAYLANFILYPRKVQLLSKEFLFGSVLMFFVYSADEISQIFIPGRDADPFDLAASLIGLLIGDWLVHLWERRQK